MNQITFSEAGCQTKKRKTRREACVSGWEI